MQARYSRKRPTTSSSQSYQGSMKYNEQARVAPLDIFLKILFMHRKNATRTPRARPEAWCLVRLLAVVGIFWARSLRSTYSQCILFERARCSIAYQQRPLCFSGLSFLKHMSATLWLIARLKSLSW